MREGASGGEAIATSEGNRMVCVMDDEKNHGVEKRRKE